VTAKSRWLPPEDQLLPREEFKRLVFLRSGGKCVFCDQPAVDAHHVLERKLYPLTGGYFLGNGAAVCDAHHWKCETTELSVEEVRVAAGILAPVLPECLDAARRYDKWGNLLLDDGMREAGPLATDDGMRRALTQGRFIGLLLPTRTSA
jgi:hypothetical protein